MKAESSNVKLALRCHTIHRQENRETLRYLKVLENIPRPKELASGMWKMTRTYKVVLDQDRR